MRMDKRKNDELRELVIKPGVLSRCDGSAYVKMGNTVAVAGVFGPRKLFPRWEQEPQEVLLRCRYNMAPFSTKERKAPGRDRRSTEISLLTEYALEPSLFLEEFPKAGIDVFIEILQGDAGTRCAGINAASVALADAGLPMRDLVCAVAVGMVGKDPVLDLTYDEEVVTKADIPIALMPNENKITLLQMDGDLSPKDVKKLLSLGIKGCKQIYEAQKKALKSKYTEGLK